MLLLLHVVAAGGGRAGCTCKGVPWNLVALVQVLPREPGQAHAVIVSPCRRGVEGLVVCGAAARRNVLAGLVGPLSSKSSG